MIRRILIAGAAALLTSLAHAQTPLRVTSFPGGANLPLWVAEDRGFFAHELLSVQLSPATSSVALFQSLDKDEQDIALAAFDNVVAYQEGQGEVTLSGAPDFFAFMGVTRGTLRLVVNPAVKNYEDLRGKVLGVDAVATGYSLVLQKMLQLRGLESGDYVVQSIGGTAARAQALMEDKISGTILTTPLEVLPEERGFHRLNSAADVIGPYQAIVGVARRGWAASHRQTLVRFIRASISAVRWIRDPAHRVEVVAIYRQHLPKLPEDMAVKQVEALLAQDEGFEDDGVLQTAGIATVLQLRSEFGAPRKTLHAASYYVDESFRKAAIQ